MSTLAITVAASLVAGVVGAMAYMYLFGSKGSDSVTSHASRHSGSSTENDHGGPTSDRAAGTNQKREPGNAQSTQAISAQAAVAPAEAENLKRQVHDLTARVEHLGEDMQRLENLLSVAVPLLQRAVSKN
jgi:hypothetical protein